MFQFNTLATCFECFELENLEETWMENEKRKKKVDFSKEEFFSRYSNQCIKFNFLI